MAKMVLIPLCLALAFAPLCFAECGGSRAGGCGGSEYETVRTVPAVQSYSVPSYSVKTVRYESSPSYYREYSTPVVRESSPCRSGGCSSYTYERTVPSSATVVRESSPCRSGGCSSYSYESRAVPVVTEVRSQPVVYERVYSSPQVYSVPSSYSSGCSTGRCGGSYSTRTVEYSAPSYSSYSYSSPVSYSSGGGCRSGGCGKKK